MNNPFGNRGYRRTRRGVSKRKNQNNEELEDALKKLKGMEKLEAKVNTLQHERQKVLDDERKKIAAEEAVEAEEEQYKKLELLVNKAEEAAKQKEILPTATSPTKEEETNKETKKGWFSWFADW